MRTKAGPKKTFLIVSHWSAMITLLGPINGSKGPFVLLSKIQNLPKALIRTICSISPTEFEAGFRDRPDQ
ncbi:hypothetical protein C1J03_17555 [Sulfitobacter sp. SK012]|nr:hypothetical protein C1J03_17555 [Sulfitobacter sp. SK012]